MYENVQVLDDVGSLLMLATYLGSCINMSWVLRDLRFLDSTSQDPLLKHCAGLTNDGGRGSFTAFRMCLAHMFL